VHQASAALFFCMLQCGIKYDRCCASEKAVVKRRIKKFDGRIPSTQLK